MAGVVGASSGFGAGALLSRVSAMWVCVASCFLSTLAFLLLWSAELSTRFYQSSTLLTSLYNFLAGNYLK